MSNCVCCGNYAVEGNLICPNCHMKVNKTYADMEQDLKAAHEEIGRLMAELEKFYISDTSKVKFFKDKNIKKWAKSEYAWCERPCEHNMSMSAFDKQGEVNGYASEYYWIFNDGCEEVKEITANEFMHEFVKPLIKENTELKARLERAEVALFAVIRNSKIMPKGKVYGGIRAWTDDTTLETIVNIYEMIDFEAMGKAKAEAEARLKELKGE